MRVFVALGTHPQQFNRLLEKIDSLLEEKKLKAEVFAQSGNSTYNPKHFRCKKFLPSHEFEQEFKKADIAITHGGAGSIISALRHSKPLVIVPRRKEYNEHTDNHQLDLALALDKRGKAIAVLELEKLGAAIKKAQGFNAEKHSEKKELIARIKRFLREGK